jgi:cytochrome P450
VNRQAAECPIPLARDDRKSARLAAERLKPAPGARVADRFLFAREILRSGAMRQGGVGLSADRFPLDDPEKVPVFFLDGEPHRRKRAEIARFFTPTAIATRYRATMERTTDALLARMRSDGRGRLDRISFELAVTVAADIVGLTSSDRSAMAARIAAALYSGIGRRRHRMTRWASSIRQSYHSLRFFVRDVKPAIAARRRTRGDDVISHLVDEGYADKAILIECLTYAAAGMVTTREFIVMAAWHLFERDDLRCRFVAGSEDDQFAILEEILRLEPVASMITRRAAEPTPSIQGEIAADTLIAIDIRAANLDESVVGTCPYALDPDRAKRGTTNGTHLSFGDGRHRCPGAQVALHETRVFLDRLFRIPGIRLVGTPTLRWCDELGSYELRDAIVACDRA